MKFSRKMTVAKVTSELTALWHEFDNNNFKYRKEVVKVWADRLETVKREHGTKEGIFDFFSQIHSLFLDLHIKKTVREVKEKYNLIGKNPTAKDFYRICKAEKIEVCPLKMRVTSYYTIGGVLKNEPVIFLHGEKKGAAKRGEMFMLLGVHFLHKEDLLGDSKAPNIFAIYQSAHNIFNYDAFLFLTEILKKEVRREN